MGDCKQAVLSRQTQTNWDLAKKSCVFSVFWGLDFCCLFYRFYAFLDAFVAGVSVNCMRFCGVTGGGKTTEIPM